MWELLLVEKHWQEVDWGVWEWIEDVRQEFQSVQLPVGKLANRTVGQRSGFGDSKQDLVGCRAWNVDNLRIGHGTHLR